MKDNSKRKTLQGKLNHYISEFVLTLAKTDSKKLKKSIKKASKLIAKAILKNSEESEVELSLKDDVTPGITSSKKSVRKHTHGIKANIPVLRRHKIKRTTRKRLSASVNNKTKKKAQLKQRKPIPKENTIKPAAAEIPKNNGAVSSPEKV